MIYVNDEPQHTPGPGPAPQAAQQKVNHTVENGLWSGRTHWKVLIWPAFVQLILIAAHLLLFRYWPERVGVEFIDDWGQLIVHGIIVCVEIWYVVIPALRWWHGTFTVTDRRVIKHWGILYKHSREIPMVSIVSVSVERGIIDRIFGCGTLVFQDAAAGFQPRTHGVWNQGSESRFGVRFTDVPRVYQVREVVDRARFDGQTTYQGRAY